MKKTLLILILAFSCSYSQQTSVTFHLTDTVGTATTIWKVIPLLRSATRVLVEVINDSSSTNYMLVAASRQDTIASSTRYQSRLNTLESIQYYTNRDTVYIKSSAGNAKFRVKTY